MLMRVGIGREKTRGTKIGILKIAQRTITVIGDPNPGENKRVSGSASLAGNKIKVLITVCP